MTIKYELQSVRQLDSEFTFAEMSITTDECAPDLGYLSIRISLPIQKGFANEPLSSVQSRLIAGLQAAIPPASFLAVRALGETQQSKVADTQHPPARA